jgi:hypothetical protein
MIIQKTARVGAGRGGVGWLAGGCLQRGEGGGVEGQRTLRLPARVRRLQRNGDGRLERDAHGAPHAARLRVLAKQAARKGRDVLVRVALRAANAHRRQLQQRHRNGGRGLAVNVEAHNPIFPIPRAAALRVNGRHVDLRDHAGRRCATVIKHLGLRARSNGRVLDRVAKQLQLAGEG